MKYERVHMEKEPGHEFEPLQTILDLISSQE